MFVRRGESNQIVLPPEIHMARTTPATVGGAAFAPSDIAGLVAWFDASAESFNDDDAVGTATDQSGNGNDAVQTTEAKKPTYKTGILGGNAVFRFDGSADVLVTAGGVLSANTADFSAFFVVANYTASSNNNRPWSVGYDVSGGAIEMVSYGFDSTSVHSIRFDGAARTFSQADTDPSLIGVLRDTAFTEAIVARFNGSEVLAEGTDSTDNTLGNSRVSMGGSKGGSEQNFGGDVGEMVIYESFVSGGDITSLETYLNDKWSVY